MNDDYCERCLNITSVTRDSETKSWLCDSCLTGDNQQQSLDTDALKTAIRQLGALESVMQVIRIWNAGNITAQVAMERILIIVTDEV
jgi:hypothetical protein